MILHFPSLTCTLFRDRPRPVCFTEGLEVVTGNDLEAGGNYRKNQRPRYDKFLTNRRNRPRFTVISFIRRGLCRRRFQTVCSDESPVCG